MYGVMTGMHAADEKKPYSRCDVCSRCDLAELCPYLSEAPVSHEPEQCFPHQGPTQPQVEKADESQGRLVLVFANLSARSSMIRLTIL